MINPELEEHQEHKEFISTCSYCQQEKLMKEEEKQMKEFEEKEKEKEIEELSRQLLAKEKWCPILSSGDRPCLKERCSWWDTAEERCIIITIANILAGQKVVR